MSRFEFPGLQAMNDATTPDDPNAPGLGVATPERAPHYRVLARKYRPASFDDLIGQEAMVRTVSNAFETGRIPQAWILTGVRGVGKTTTARILARALNFALPDGSVTGPTIKMPVLGLECQAIMESRHVDVLEMDAASHNSVDDIRQINDAVRYAPVSARYKVYILDEVHMLSGAAFNALLKTLEEPPPHAKFIFATTEIRKVPVTVLSRCQRFDLRRVEAGVLVAHLEGITGKEGLTAEPEALALIARAAEGSVRDALSLLDQAIAHAAGSVRAEDVRQMLGLADRSRVIDLFDALMKGDIAGALKELRDQYDAGADPAIVLTDLAEFTHFVTRVKVVPAVADDRSLAEIERTRGRAFAAALSMRVLSRTWQMLFKGIPEVQSAAKSIAAAEMVLVRIAYAADLPTPDELVRTLADGESGAAPRRHAHGEGGGATARLDAPRETPRDAPTPRCAAPRRPGGRGAAAAGAGRAAGRGCAVRRHAGHPRALRGPDRARRGQARPADQVGARARRTSRPFRDRAAGSGAGAERLQGDRRRSRAQDQPVDRATLDGGGVGRAGPAHRPGAERGAPRRARARRAAPPAGQGRAGAFSGRTDRRSARGRAGAAAVLARGRCDAARASDRRRQLRVRRADRAGRPARR